MAINPNQQSGRDIMRYVILGLIVAITVAWWLLAADR